MKMLAIQRANGWAQFVSMQDHLNLLYREEEREMMPLCSVEGIGVIPWSPLARGKLTRPWGTDTKRSDTDDFGKTLYDGSEEADKAIVAAVVKIAEARGVKPAQVALAWVLQKQPVTAPIVGATKVGHLTDAVGALEVKLTTEEIATLEAPYRPRAVAGFR
jgi:aryl-alcohol dehydrogenase-like predicted oxidoreductase